MDKYSLRILDANYNRAKEAIRVCEDIARFFLKDAKLTSRLKRCRHEITQVILDFPVPYRELVAARNNHEDVGRASWIQDGKKRPGWKDLMAANLQRSQEASRVLEETAKAVAPRRAGQFQRIRFRLYELEKQSFRKF